MRPAPGPGSDVTAGAALCASSFALGGWGGTVGRDEGTVGGLSGRDKEGQSGGQEGQHPMQVLPGGWGWGWEHPGRGESRKGSNQKQSQHARPTLPVLTPT